MLDDSFREENTSSVLKILLLHVFHGISEDVLKGRGKPVEGVSDHHYPRARQKSLWRWKRGPVVPRHVVVVFYILCKELIKTNRACLLRNAEYQVTWKD